MTPKECFKKWDSESIVHGSAEYREMIEDIESTNDTHDVVVVGEYDLVVAIAFMVGLKPDLVTIHVRLKNGESEDIPSYWK
jgi:chemotaxis response regulator CheB